MPLAQGPQASLSPLPCRGTSPLGPTTRLPHRLCFRICFPLQYNHLSVKYKSWKERQALNTQLSVGSLRLPEGKEGEEGLLPTSLSRSSFMPPQSLAPADRELTGVMGGGRLCILRKYQAFSGPQGAYESAWEAGTDHPFPPWPEKGQTEADGGGGWGVAGGVGRRGAPAIIAVRCPGTPGIPGNLAGVGRDRAEAVLCLRTFQHIPCLENCLSPFSVFA